MACVSNASNEHTRSAAESAISDNNMLCMVPGTGPAKPNATAPEHTQIEAKVRMQRNMAASD